jgi:general secretion pathway protein A
MILHRMRVAGYTPEQSPFTPDAIFEIHKFTGGTPRLTSQLADNALMIAFMSKAKIIDGFLMHGVIADYAGIEEAA